MRGIADLRFATGLLAAALLVAPPAAAETYRVDDSGSHVLGSAVRMKWDSLVPRQAEDHGVSGVTQVQIRLNAMPWAGRLGRIYLRLPPQAVASASWSGRGVLQPGTVRAGERALVFAGIVPDAPIEDVLVLRLHADGREIEQPGQLEFSFEIDPEP